MNHVTCKALKNAVALVCQTDRWVLVLPCGFDLAEAARIALRSLSTHIPETVADELRAAAEADDGVRPTSV